MIRRNRDKGSGGRIGLRGRIVVRFGGLALILSLMLGLITYVSVRRVLVEDRETSSASQVAGDALLIRASLAPGLANPGEVMASLRPPATSNPLLLRDGEWFAASLQVRPEDLPDDLIQLVVSGQSAGKKTLLNREPVYIVGIDLGPDVGTYFEVFSLVDILDTLTTLSWVLIIAGTLTTAAGAVLGGLIAHSAMRPLVNVTEVARNIASGDLQSRLDETLDKDLEVLTASFNRMADSLQIRIAKEARFASDVSHELRTPLTTLLTSLAVLEGRREELGIEGREALELLGRDVRRLEHTAADLIEIAKLDAGAVTADVEMLPVSTIISRTLHRLRRTDLPVEIDQEAARSLMKVDERRFERVLANLIENADTHGQGATLLSVRSKPGIVRIAVEDSGPGLRPDEMERIFDRFARGSNSQPSGHYSGSGLGLSLAAENMELQGGRIWAENTAAGGARFVVEFESEAIT